MSEPLKTPEQFLAHEDQKVWACFVFPSRYDESRAARIRKSGVLKIATRHLTAALQRRGYSEIAEMWIEGFDRTFGVDNHRLDRQTGHITISDNGHGIYIFHSREERETWMNAQVSQFEAEKQAMLQAIAANLGPEIREIRFQ